MSHPSTWRNKLLVAIPCAELAYSVFWQRIMTLRDIGWHIDNGMLMTISNAYVQEAHNKIVKEALAMEGWDRLLLMEHDHLFPDDILEKMAAYREPIVSALYFGRSIEDPQPILYEWNEDRSSILRYQPWQVAELIKEPGLHPVDVVPMGCCSIRRDVLERWPEEVPVYAVATTQQKVGGIMGDDVWFCRHAQDQGYARYVDSRVVITHMGLVPINLSVYNGWVSKMREKGLTGVKA